MAREGHLETLVPEERIQGEAMDDDADSGEEREVQELEREIKDLAQRILDSRRSMPDRLSQALASRLLALRPSLPSITIPGAFIDSLFAYSLSLWICCWDLC